jgi:hypothetical protein
MDALWANTVRNFGHNLKPTLELPTLTVLQLCCYYYRCLLVVKGPAAGTTDVPQPWGLLCNPVMKVTMMIIIFCPLPSNGAPVEWNWQAKTDELREKPVPVPLCPPQIPHRLTRDRTRASAVGCWRLTAWAMARPIIVVLLRFMKNLLHWNAVNVKFCRIWPQSSHRRYVCICCLDNSL